jgi:GntR family transcriptional regulator
MTDDLGARAPKYLQIADALRRDIKDGTYSAGDQLPAETALLERFRSQFGTLSLPTLRQALAVLRAEGLIASQQGIGTFVRSDRRLQRRSRHRYGRARADRQLLTSHLEHQIYFSGPSEVPQAVADASTLDAGERVVLRRRLLRDKETGQPQELGASYIPASIAGGTYLEEPTVVPKALFLCVEELSGRHYTHASDRWQVRPATGDEAMLLDVQPGSPVIHLIHNAADENGDTLEVSESVWPSDRIVVIDDYAIAQAPEDQTGMSDV